MYTMFRIYTFLKSIFFFVVVVNQFQYVWHIKNISNSIFIKQIDTAASDFHLTDWPKLLFYCNRLKNILFVAIVH